MCAYMIRSILFLRCCVLMFCAYVLFSSFCSFVLFSSFLFFCFVLLYILRIRIYDTYIFDHLVTYFVLVNIFMYTIATRIAFCSLLFVLRRDSFRHIKYLLSRILVLLFSFLFFFSFSYHQVKIVNNQSPISHSFWSSPSLLFLVIYIKII